METGRSKEGEGKKRAGKTRLERIKGMKGRERQGRGRKEGKGIRASSARDEPLRVDSPQLGPDFVPLIGLDRGIRCVRAPLHFNLPRIIAQKKGEKSLNEKKKAASVGFVFIFLGFNYVIISSTDI